MEKKYYKIDVKGFDSLNYFGLKRNFEEHASINNFWRLRDIYKVRYPLLMDKIPAFYMKYYYEIPKYERELYGIPDYFLVTVTDPELPYFEYTELLTGVSFMVEGEVFEFKSIDFLYKNEISADEAIKLFDDDYIEKVGGLFSRLYDREKKDSAKQKLLTQLNRNV